jgi:hypothetical protein
MSCLKNSLPEPLDELAASQNVAAGAGDHPASSDWESDDLSNAVERAIGTPGEI